MLGSFTPITRSISSRLFPKSHFVANWRNSEMNMATLSLDCRTLELNLNLPTVMAGAGLKWLVNVSTSCAYVLSVGFCGVFTS